MSPIKDFKLKYEAVNKENTFTAGDTIKGTVSFTLTEEIKIKCLYVKAKGDAIVCWSESSGDDDTDTTYRDHRRYYKVKEALVAENKDGTALSKGDHCYQFKITIPEGNIPPSFQGYLGKIDHVVQAKMSRSWHKPSTDQKELNFVSFVSFDTFDQSPQAGSVKKSVGIFSKGEVHLSATVNKRICSPGDTLEVTAKITNKSSKKMKIKFKTEQRIMYHALSKTNMERANVCKIVGETIQSGFNGDVSCQVQVPVDTKLSILNCEIISVEFVLKVYLSIRFAVNPEVVLPLIIAAPDALTQHGQHGFPSTNEGVDGPSTPPFSGPYPEPTGSGEK